MVSKRKTFPVIWLTSATPSKQVANFRMSFPFHTSPGSYGEIVVIEFRMALSQPIEQSCIDQVGIRDSF